MLYKLKNVSPDIINVSGRLIHPKQEIKTATIEPYRRMLEKGFLKIISEEDNGSPHSILYVHSKRKGENFSKPFIKMNYEINSEVRRRMKSQQPISSEKTSNNEYVTIDNCPTSPINNLFFADTNSITLSNDTSKSAFINNSSQSDSENSVSQNDILENNISLSSSSTNSSIDDSFKGTSKNTLENSASQNDILESNISLSSSSVNDSENDFSENELLIIPDTSMSESIGAVSTIPNSTDNIFVKQFNTLNDNLQRTINHKNNLEIHSSGFNSSHNNVSKASGLLDVQSCDSLTNFLQKLIDSIPHNNEPSAELFINKLITYESANVHTSDLSTSMSTDIFESNLLNSIDKLLDKKIATRLTSTSLTNTPLAEKSSNALSSSISNEKIIKSLFNLFIERNITAEDLKNIKLFYSQIHVLDSIDESIKKQIQAASSYEDLITILLNSVYPALLNQTSTSKNE